MPSSTWPRGTDIEVCRALNSAQYADKDGRWHGLAWVYRPGWVVTRARLRLSYATTDHYRSKTTHITRRAWIVWRHGRPVGMHVEYRCGGHSKAAHLTRQPTKPLCPRCLLVVDPERSTAALRELYKQPVQKVL